MENKTEYYAQDVVKINDVKQNTLTQWIARGFVKPSQPASGSGTRNIFSIEDLCRIELFKELNSRGFTRTGASYLCFDPFTPPESKGTDNISRAISKAIDLCEDSKSKNSNDPLGVFILIAQKGKHETFFGTKVLLTADPFKSLYRDYFSYPEILNNAITYLVNFKSIVSRVLEKIENVEP